MNNIHNIHSICNTLYTQKKFTMLFQYRNSNSNIIFMKYIYIYHLLNGILINTNDTI